MSAEFSVRINRRDGIVEIEGSDKDWIGDQLEKLSIVYATPPVDAPRLAPEQPFDGPTPDSPAPPSTLAAVAKPAKKRSGSRSTARATRSPELVALLTKPLMTDLQAFVDERQAHWSSKPNQAAIIATFLMDNVSREGWIDENDLYTVYSVMGWADAPANFRSQITNARVRHSYFGSAIDGRVQLTHAGEQFGRHGSKIPKATKS